MEDIMKYQSVLPAEFDGVFRFTNWTDEEFVGKWGSKEYHFAANSTSPMVIPEHSPLEIQHIRKKFAKDLAEKEFYKSKRYETLRSPEGVLGNRTMSGIHTANTYNITDLTDGIQKCLTPLGVKRAVVQSQEFIPMEEKLTKDDEGNLNTEAVDKKTSLRDKALKGNKFK